MSFHIHREIEDHPNLALINSDQARTIAAENQAGAVPYSIKAGTAELPAYLDFGNIPTDAQNFSVLRASTPMESATSSGPVNTTDGQLQVNFETPNGIYHDEMHVHLNDLSQAINQGNEDGIATYLAQVGKDAGWWEKHETSLGTNASEVKDLQNSMNAAQQGLALINQDHVTAGEALLKQADAQIQNGASPHALIRVHPPVSLRSV